MNSLHVTIFITVLLFELSDEHAKAEFNQKLPSIRSAIVELVSGKKPSEVQVLEGRKELAMELKALVNDRLDKGSATEVSFVGFEVL